MNSLKKLIGGGKKKGKRYDYEGDHVETDFDKAFEEARRASSVIPQIVQQECEYLKILASHSAGGSPSRSNRSKSPSPYQQQMVKKTPSSVGGARTPICARKGSAPGAATGGKTEAETAKMMAPDKDQMKRKMTESQQKKARDIVESMDWIKPMEVCSSSTEPQIATVETIQPQMHVCEMISMPKANKHWAVAIIPQKQVALPPLAASGRCISGQR